MFADFVDDAVFGIVARAVFGVFEKFFARFVFVIFNRFDTRVLFNVFVGKLGILLFGYFVEFDCENGVLLESEIDRMVQDFSYRLMYQGIKLEDYVKYMGQTMSEFREQFREQARPRVLSQLVVEKIVKSENFKAEDGEIDKKIEEQAQSVGKIILSSKRRL